MFLRGLALVAPKLCANLVFFRKQGTIVVRFAVMVVVRALLVQFAGLERARQNKKEPQISHLMKK